MKHTEFNIEAKTWIYPGKAAWHFVTIPKDVSEDIKNLFGDRAKGWGSLPVMITLRKTTWKTSIFPDKKEGAYLLPLKAEIRKKENIHIGDSLIFILEIKLT